MNARISHVLPDTQETWLDAEEQGGDKDPLKDRLCKTVTILIDVDG